MPKLQYQKNSELTPEPTDPKFDLGDYVGDIVPKFKAIVPVVFNFL